MKTLMGYSDVISLRAGDPIAFKVSNSLGTRYAAQIVRLISGDTNPAGPGYQEQEIPGAEWSLQGRNQPVRCGSCLVIPVISELPLTSFSLELLVWPSMPDKPDQVLASLWEPDARKGFQLVLDGRSGLTLRLANGEGLEAVLTLASTMLERHWYRIEAGFDEATGRAILRQTPVSPEFAVREHHTVEARVSLASLGAPCAPLVFAARPGAQGDFEGHYNGKLEAPRLWAGPRAGLDRAQPIGAWDFSLDISGNAINDVSGQERHGYARQLPARGMTGHDWTGELRSWQHAPTQYGAIHFHDDDLQDAGWTTDFTWTSPADLPSGLYAARLTSETDEDHIPFVVRPAPNAARNTLLFIVPTASYLAYANEHMALDLDFAERVHDHVPAFGPNDLYLAAHRELGGSLYDRHNDGSPIFCSSRLRPILNMRPKHQSWLGGGTGSGLWQLNADTHLLAWLEAEGIPHDCISDEDLDREGVAGLAGYRCVMTGTHPEYWSTRMRDGLDAFRAQAGRIMYMGGNGLYWRIAYDPSGSGTIEVRRGEGGTRPGEACHAFSGEYGGLWRRIGRPPQQSVGVGFIGQGFDVCSYYRRMQDSNDPRASFIFEGVQEEIIGDFGLIGGGAAGIELDRADFSEGTPAHALILARSENHTSSYLTSLDMLPINCLGTEMNHPIHADMVFFETGSGGAVFSTGSIAWAGSLSHEGYRNNVARISGNVLRRFLDPTPFRTPHFSV